MLQIRRKKRRFSTRCTFLVSYRNVIALDLYANENRRFRVNIKIVSKGEVSIKFDVEIIYCVNDEKYKHTHI